MRKHLQYLRYVLRHKLFVFQECRTYGASLWQALVHDLSKFSPSEWGPYVEYFYGGPHPKASEIGVYERQNYGLGRSAEAVEERFNTAWLHHQHVNPHHWQHWVLRNDDGTLLALEMPGKFVREMVADWAGAGRAIHGKRDLLPWYMANREKMALHPATRRWVEDMIGVPEGLRMFRSPKEYESGLPETIMDNGGEY